MADKCRVVSRKLVDAMREWHYAVDNYEDGKISYERFKREREEAIAELSELLKDANKVCR